MPADVEAMVVTDGMRVRAFGWLTRSDGDYALALARRSSDPVQQFSGVRQDPLRLPGLAPPPAVDGLLTVEGSWSAGQILAGSVRFPRPGEWAMPVEDLGSGIHQGRLAELSAEVRHAIDALTSDGSLLWCRTRWTDDGRLRIIAGGPEPDVATAVLSRLADGELTIIESAVSRQDIDAARATLLARADEWQTFEVGAQITGAGQYRLTASVLFVAPSFAAWVAGLPPGLMAVFASVRPAG
ncbi:hypothetical protein [Kribbella flavida]|nr:hypothetical protein [Kribbella flavida]